MSAPDQLLELSMGIDDFSSEWLHCDRISSYVARIVSHNRRDSVLYANLLSSALNELLETVFSHHGPAGEFSCRVRRSGLTDVIELTLPCDDVALRFYADAVDVLQRCDISDVYQTALFSTSEPDPRLGLFEVAVDYQAKISIASAGDRLTLSAEMTLEDTN
jgi:hypothetical protein